MKMSAVGITPTGDPVFIYDKYGVFVKSILGGGNFLSHTTTGSTQQTNDRKRFRDVYQASPSHTRQSLAKKEPPRGRGGSLSPPRSALSVGSDRCYKSQPKLFRVHSTDEK